MLLATAAVAALITTGAGGATSGTPPLPAHWPATLQLGMADSPGGARALRRAAPLGFRYQYLAGGANTGSGWSTWNPNGSFVTRYDTESWAVGIIPVYSYYQLLQSKPVEPGGEDAVDLAHLDDPTTMAAYWADVRLFFRRANGRKPVVLHVEPDLWGYIEQAARNDNAATVSAVVPGNLPQTAAGFAQEFIRLRDALAPNVILAYHMSGWGTKHDIVYEKPPAATVGAYAAHSATFYRSLGAQFDVSFEDFSDRDAGYYQNVEHNPRTWFKPADFARHLLYASTFVRLAGIRMVAWQIPLGNTVMRAENNTERPLPGQPRPVAPRTELASPPARIRERRLRRLPLRPRRRRQHMRLRLGERRRNESGADRRQHNPIDLGRRRRRLLQTASAQVLQGAATHAPGLTHSWRLGVPNRCLLASPHAAATSKRISTAVRREDVRTS